MPHTFFQEICTIRITTENQRKHQVITQVLSFLISTGDIAFISGFVSSHPLPKGAKKIASIPLSTIFLKSLGKPHHFCDSLL